MTAPMESPHRARTHAAGARARRAAVAGLAVRAHDDVLCAVRAVDAASASSARLTWAAVPAFQKFGLGSSVTNVWDPVKLNFGALAPIYGTLVTSAIALLIGVPVELSASRCS